MSENGEIYTAGKNVTLLPAVTAWTNSTSAIKSICINIHGGKRIIVNPSDQYDRIDIIIHCKTLSSRRQCCKTT